MHLERLQFRRDGPVAHLVLSGEPLGGREAAELVSTAGALAEDRDVRAVVLSSRGADFCPAAAADLDPGALALDPAAALAAVRAPVVSTCAGSVASVGLELALACDIRLAHPSATFSLDDLRRGRLPCWGGTQRLPRAVGRPRALAMILLGEIVDAAEACRAGLVHEVVDDLGAGIEELVATLLSVAPLALELAKEAVARGSELPLRDGLRLEGDLNHLLQTTTDRAEGLQAFFDKRPPSFTGR